MPCFSENRIAQQEILHDGNNEIISYDYTLADTFNIFFTNIVGNLGITGYPTEDDITESGKERISIIINNFKIHPTSKPASIINMKIISR